MYVLDTDTKYVHIDAQNLHAIIVLTHTQIRELRGPVAYIKG